MGGDCKTPDGKPNVDEAEWENYCRQTETYSEEWKEGAQWGRGGREDGTCVRCVGATNEVFRTLFWNLSQMDNCYPVTTSNRVTVSE